MNKKQLQVNKKLLDEEKEVMKRLRLCYADAYKEVSKKVLKFSDNPEMISRIHQKKYHQALQKQIKQTLNLLDSGKVSSIDEFLNKTAETSFIGSLYEFNEDVPLLLAIDNKTISSIINKKVDDFSFSERLHGDTKKLTDVTVNEISRGFSTGMSFEDMALNIKNRFTHDMNNAFRIAQTEGHRVSQETAYDTAKRFKEKGADIVKQWDSTMDKKTRPHHVKLDGQIRELEDPFEVEGHKAMYPGAFGLASEDIRCRCVMVKRARWALGEDETKWDGDQDKLVTIKAKGYEEFKQKYEKEIKSYKLKEFYATDDKSVKMKIREDEVTITKNEFESAIAYDQKGNVIFKKDGEKHEVAFTNEDIKLMKDAIVTHNHPNDVTFSPDDIYMMISADMQELRATTSKGTYILRRNDRLSLMPSKEQFEIEHRLLYIKYRKAYKKKYPNWNEDVDRMDRVVQNNVMNNLARKYELDYNFEE